MKLLLKVSGTCVYNFSPQFEGTSSRAQGKPFHMIFHMTHLTEEVPRLHPRRRYLDCSISHLFRDFYIPCEFLVGVNDHDFSVKELFSSFLNNLFSAASDLPRLGV